MIKTEHFRHNLKRVTLAHLAFIVLLFVFLGISTLFDKLKKKPPLTIPVDFVVQPAQQEYVKEAEPVYEPKEVVKPEKEKPVPKETIYKKPEIKVSRKKVVRQNKKVVRPPVKKKISEELIRKELESGLTAGASYSLTEEQKNMVRIRNALYKAWQQPSKASVGDTAVTLQISFDGKGNIIASRIVGGGSNIIMEKSVLAAVSKVRSVPGLTKEFLKRNRNVTILFRVE